MLCLICARSGSKGLKNKNILKINNKSLLQITIELAKKIKAIKHIVLSTDSKKIAELGKRFGAEIPFLRPRFLSTDTAPEWKVWQHAIHQCEKKYIFNDVLILPVVSPLKTKKDIDKVINMHKKNKKKCVITVTNSSRNPYFNMVTLDKERNAKIVLKKKKKIHRRQDTPAVFDICTVAYLLNKKLITRKKSLFDCKVVAQLIPKKRSIDIDDQIDFKIAKYLYEKKISI
mgnify:CR=1 FL=1|jgi:CMP-N-acetylneuraminic acid synthetase